MLFVALDSETSIKNRGDGAVGTSQGSPHAEQNKIVSLGEMTKRGGEKVYFEQYDRNGVKELPYFLKRALEGHDVLMVMHNAPFDFAHIVNTWPEETMAALPKLFLWDTMQVEYLLEGQSLTMPSLDSCAERRDLPLKDDRLKEFWKAGVDTEDIPPDILLPYMKQDVENTLDIFLDQWNTASMSPKMLELIRVKMDDKLLTTFMEIYGMRFDVGIAMELLDEVESQQKVLYTEIIEEASKYFEEDFTFNPSSPEQVSTLLFGGEYTVERQVEVVGEDGEPVRFKTGARKGEVKTRKEAIKLHTPGLRLKAGKIPKTAKGYSTGDEHLSKLSHPLVAKLLTYRGLVKDGSTYYKGYSALVWPDGMIRPSINHEVAATGRQSCSQPNLQNVSKEVE